MLRVVLFLLLTVTAHAQILAGGGPSGALANVRGDIHGGGIAAKLIGTVISGGVKGAEMGVGPTAGVISAAKAIFDPAFLFGNIPGGVIGGALGAAIPLPAIFSRMGIAGEMLKLAPPLLGAVFGSAALMHAIDLKRDGRLTAGNLLDRLDVASLLAVSAGVDIAVILSRFFVPALRLGPINLTEVAAALVGGWLSSKILAKLRAHDRPSSTLATGLHVDLPAITGPTTGRADQAYRAYLAAEKRGDTQAARAAHHEYVAASRAH